MAIGVTQKEVLVRLVGEVKGFEKWDKVSGTIKKVGGVTKELNGQYASLNNGQQRLVDVQVKYGKNGEKQSRINDRIIKQNERFHMEYLGLLFAGMALQRTMAGINQTSKEWLGINELMSTAMGVVTLPAMMGLLNDAVLPLVEGLLELPEGVQLTIGVSTLALEAVGGLASIVGQGAMGMYALKQLGVPISTTGKIAGAGVGIVLAVSSIALLNSGIKEGDILKEVYGMLGALGSGAAAGFAIAGVPGAVGGIIITMGATLVMSLTAAKAELADKEKTKKEFDKQMSKMKDDFMKENEGGTPTTLPSQNISAPFTPPKEISMPTSMTSQFNATGPFTGGFTTPTTTKSSNMFSNIWNSLFGKKGERAVGGNIPNTGMYMMHEGERVLRKDEVSNANSSQSVNITYNVNVSDKREFENMLKDYSRRMTEDIRRLSK